jgi:hypothetical protein
LARCQGGEHAGSFTTVVYLIYRSFRRAEPERRLPLLLGAVLGLSLPVRRAE